MVEHACSLSTWDVKAEESEFQGQPWLRVHSGLNKILSQMETKQKDLTVKGRELQKGVIKCEIS